MCGLLCLAFTEQGWKGHPYYKGHPYCSLNWYLIPFYYWIIFQCMIYHILLICSSIDGHQGCFYFVAIMNNAAIYICLQVLSEHVCNLGVSVQFSLSCVWLSVTPWTAAYQASLSITNSQRLLKLMSIESMMPFHPLFSSSPSAFSLSQHQDIFQWVSSSHQVPKVLELSFSINPSNEYSKLISFRIDWFDLLVGQGSLKSLLQHNSKYQFFSAQPSLWSNSHIHTWQLEKP